MLTSIFIFVVGVVVGVFVGVKYPTEAKRAQSIVVEELKDARDTISELEAKVAANLKKTLRK